MLEIHIPDAKMSEGLLSQKLEKYKIFLGVKWNLLDWRYRSKTSRMLKLSLNTNEDENILQYLKGIEELELGEVPGATNLFDALGRNGFPTLKHLDVDSNSHCSCIVESCDALPLLESFDVGEMEVLEKICNRPLGANSFLQLTTIRVRQCHKLNNIFSSSAVTILPQLQEIRVSSCKNMEEIFAIGGHHDASNTEVVHEIELSQLRILSLNRLSRLKSFCCKVKTDSPLQLTNDTKPREIISEEEMDICTLLFNEKVAFPNLQTLRISDIHVEKIWHNLPPKISSYVKNLTRLSVSSCCNLKELFSSSTVVTEQSREEEMRDTIILFPKLNYLHMKSLKKLTTLWSGYYIAFPTLKEFIIESCHRLDAFIFDDKVAFPNLQTLYISDIPVEKIWHNLPPKISSCVQNLTWLRIHKCGNLKELISSSTVITEESREEEMRDTIILFPKLNYLEITNLEKLTTLWSGYHIEFPTLKEFRIQSCPQLDAFIFDDKVRVPSLEEMTIRYMDNLKMIWHNQLDGNSFPKLKSLQVGDCQKLLTLFPLNIRGRFLTPESLTVTKCGSLEEIFDLQGIISEERSSQSRELCFSNLQELKVSFCQSLKYLFATSNNVANDEYSPKFLFPKLTCMELSRLPELRSFYPGRHTVEWPVLKTLNLWDCFIHDTDKEDQMQMQQPFFFVEQAFPCLEELILAGKNVMMMWQGQVPKSLFDKLKILKVRYDDSAVLPLCIIQRFKCLEKLSLLFSSYKEIFSNGEDERKSATPPRIKTLCLYRLDDLKYMWKRNFKLDLILQNLEALNIEGCNSLINVMPPSASFQNLTVMQVECCSCLINIGTSTAAKSLVQLTQMKIKKCFNITEVVGIHGDVTEDEIIFPKLKRLQLQDLPRLTSFCSWNVTLQFPLLEELIVDHCPNMKIFSGGVLTTRTLWEIKIDKESIELCPDVDINKAIQQFHEKVNVKRMQRLQEGNKLKKAKQHFDEEANVQSSIKDCEGSSSHLEIKGDPM